MSRQPQITSQETSRFGKTSPGKTKELFVTITVYVTMTQRSVTLCKPTGSKLGPHTVSWNSRGSGRSGLSRTLKGRPKNAA
eukprot:7627422-Ditylum_brightwellii.AAC.1